MNRRAFLRRVVAVPIAAAAAPIVAQLAPPRHVFRRDAFAQLFDPDGAVSIRFIQQYHRNRLHTVNRLDVISGFVQPHLAVRVVE